MNTTRAQQIVDRMAAVLAKRNNRLVIGQESSITINTKSICIELYLDLVASQSDEPLSIDCGDGSNFRLKEMLLITPEIWSGNVQALERTWQFIVSKLPKAELCLADPEEVLSHLEQVESPDDLPGFCVDIGVTIGDFKTRLGDLVYLSEIFTESELAEIWPESER